jgi:hypothetical protein
LGIIRMARGGNTGAVLIFIKGRIYLFLAV